MPHMAEFSAIQQQIFPYLLKIHSKTDIYHRLLLPLRTTENKDKYYFIENNNYAVWTIVRIGFLFKLNFHDNLMMAFHFSIFGL